MSMLAERKRKQKWSLNPRGNNWVQDSNKFGQKMLEKMGWQNGKGLGAKEDGITEHIKVSYKNDSKGVGFKESDNQWTEHENNFSSLLESLSGEKPKEVKLNSLEKKSQTSRARVHYHKFTRGKDLSRYSEKDLANIFGKKSLKEPPKQEVADEKTDVNGGDENQSKFLFNAGSMRDYFKKKLPSFGKSGSYIVGDNGVLRTEESDSESDVRPSFGLNVEDEVSYAGLGLKSQTVSDKDDAKVLMEGESDKQSSKKKRRVAEDEIENVFSPKKKPRKSKSESRAESKGVSNPAFNPLVTPVKVQKHVLDTIEESVSEDLSDSSSSLQYVQTTIEIHDEPMTRKKKKQLSERDSSYLDTESCSEVNKSRKDAKQQENGIVNSVFVEKDVVDLTFTSDKENKADLSPYEVKRKKNKKNQNCTGIIENNLNVERSEESLNVLATDESITLKKSKTSKKKKAENGDMYHIDLTNSELSTSSIVEDVVSDTKMKKKKKGKLKSLDNPAFVDVAEETVELTQSNNPYEVKLKRKKNIKGFDNVNFNESIEDNINEPENKENPYEVKTKQKKKKKKGKEVDRGMENPNFTESLEDSVSSEIKENPYEIKSKKKKKKKRDSVLAIDNPNFNLDDSKEVEESVESELEKQTKGTTNVTPPVTINGSTTDVTEIEDNDLMLNIVTTPIIQRSKTTEDCTVTKVSSIKRRKSVRFSDVTREHIIPNNDDLRDIENRNELFEINTKVINNGLKEQNVNFDMSALDKVNFNICDNNVETCRKKKRLGLDNAAFDKHKAKLDENLDSISKTIDRYEAEIDNDINEKKLETMEDFMVGEVGNSQGDNEKVPDGVKLKFRYANFVQKTPMYQLGITGSKKSYKHLIKGDILVGFKNTNLHEIKGYASKSTVV